VIGDLTSISSTRSSIPPSKKVRSLREAQQSVPEDRGDNAPDAGDSGAIPSLFLRLSIFPVGRRPAARPSASTPLRTPRSKRGTSGAGRKPLGANQLSHHYKRDNMLTTRRIQSGEADLFKQIRLTSLQNAPYAFSSTYDSALQRTAESWREQAESTALGIDRATFITFSNDEPVGIAALYRLDNQADVGEMLQVWVAPEYRGTSVAWDLMNAIFTWANKYNFRTVLAKVANENSRAVKFYIKYGFSIASTDEYLQQNSDSVVLVKEVTKE
jgi:RimJ/RimL family protein N-acetyltransferase